MSSAPVLAAGFLTVSTGAVLAGPGSFNPHAGGRILIVGIGTATQVGLRFDASMSSARAIQLGGGKQVFDTNGNSVTLSGVISGTSGQLYKSGAGRLTLTGNVLVVTCNRSDLAGTYDVDIEFSTSPAGPWITAVDPLNATILTTDGSFGGHHYGHDSVRSFSPVRTPEGGGTLRDGLTGPRRLSFPCDSLRRFDSSCA